MSACCSSRESRLTRLASPNHDPSIARLPLGEAVFAAGIGFGPDGRTTYDADIRRCPGAGDPPLQ